MDKDIRHMMPHILRTHSALLVLTLVGTANYLDRHILGIVLPLIRSEFAVSVLNLIGLSLGPQLVGILSSLLEPRFGEHALRYALTIVTTAPVVPAAIRFWFAAQALRTTKQTKVTH